jgi:hypothetical protein
MVPEGGRLVPDTGLLILSFPILGIPTINANYYIYRE